MFASKASIDGEFINAHSLSSRLEAFIAINPKKQLYLSITTLHILLHYYFFNAMSFKTIG
jgi:hypothetical protein